eukprot:scaffold9136_cov365-Alexandrium_tamarense.AAC.2
MNEDNAQMNRPSSALFGWSLSPKTACLPLDWFLRSCTLFIIGSLLQGNNSDLSSPPNYVRGCSFSATNQGDSKYLPSICRSKRAGGAGDR